MFADSVSAERDVEVTFSLGFGAWGRQSVGTHTERTRETRMVLHEQRPDTFVVEHMRARPEANQQFAHFSAPGSTAQTGAVATHAMNSDWHTVTENKQMQQSVTLALVFRPGATSALALAPELLPLDSATAPPPSALSCLSALVLDGIISAVTQPNCPNMCAEYDIETGRVGEADRTRRWRWQWPWK